MMVNGQDRSSPTPIARWPLGCITALAIALVTAVAIFLLALHNAFDDTQPLKDARDMTRRIAETVREQLSNIGQQEPLSDQKIMDTLREHQSRLLSLERQADQTIFVAEVLGYATAPLRQVDVTICFEFTLMSPTSSEKVIYRELESCLPRSWERVNKTTSWR